MGRVGPGATGPDWKPELVQVCGCPAAAVIVACKCPRHTSSRHVTSTPQPEPRTRTRRRALEGWTSGLGEDHPDTLTAQFNLGVILEGLGRKPEALVLYKAEAAGRARRGDTARAEQRQEHITRLEAQLAAE